MSWNIVTAALHGTKYKKGQRFVDKMATHMGIKHFAYGDDDLYKSQFYEDNKEWFETSPLAKKENKYGAFVWKPQFILDAMEQLEEGDKVFYVDSMDVFHPNILKHVDEWMGDDPCLFAIGGARNGDYTKRDCFHFMDCDEEDYWDSIQLEAGFSFWRVCDEAKATLREWQKWLFDERTNGLVTEFSGKPELPGFKEVRRDQSILTNLAIRDGLSAVGEELRQFIECNADYWFSRHEKGQVPAYRPIDVFMVENKNNIDFLRPDPTDSIILTIHNQEELVPSVLKGIQENTEGDYELIIVFDGCTDQSEQVVMQFLEDSELANKTSFYTTPDVFETKANNKGLKEALGKYVTIIQDDIIVKEKGWNIRMRKPFEAFDDVFAVTARTAHNYKKGNATHLGKEDLDNCWCDIVEPCDGAKKETISRDVFAVRSTVNRGPLMMNREDLVKMDYFDEAYSPQDMDDHDLMYRVRKELNKVCGCYWIEFESDTLWGGTRKETGEPAPWLYKAHHKNSKIFYERNKDNLERIIEDRELPE